MRNFRNYVVISLVMIFMFLAVTMSNVSATSGTLLLTNGTANNTTNVATENNTTVNNVVANNTTVANNTVANTPVVTNNVNNDLEKNLPQAGENDIYIVSAIGLIALAIGGVAFIKSKKYEI